MYPEDQEESALGNLANPMEPVVPWELEEYLEAVCVIRLAQAMENQAKAMELQLEV